MVEIVGKNELKHQITEQYFSYCWKLKGLLLEDEGKTEESDINAAKADARKHTEEDIASRRIKITTDTLLEWEDRNRRLDLFLGDSVFLNLRQHYLATQIEQEKTELGEELILRFKQFLPAAIPLPSLSSFRS